MPTISHTIDINRPVQDVWAVFEDVRRLPEVSPSTTAVHGAPDRLSAVGERFTQVVKKFGRCFASEWEVVALEPGRSLTIEGSVGFGVTFRITEAVEPLGHDVTRASLTVDYKLPFGPLGRMASKLGVDRLAEAESGQVLDGLKTLLESTPANARR